MQKKGHYPASNEHLVRPESSIVSRAVSGNECSVVPTATCLRLLVFYAALCRSSAGRPAQASSSETSQAFLTLRATENRSVCRIQASVERVPDNTSGAADPLDRSGRDLPPHRSHRVNKPPHRSRYKASSEEAPFLTLNIESNNFQPTIPSLLS